MEGLELCDGLFFSAGVRGLEGVEGRDGVWREEGVEGFVAAE